MMFAAAAVVRDDQGRTFYEHPDAFTTTQLVFFPRLTDSELALYQADAIYEDEIEVLPRRRPQVPTVLFSFCDEPNHIKAEFLRGKTVLIDFIDVTGSNRHRNPDFSGAKHQERNSYSRR